MVSIFILKPGFGSAFSNLWTQYHLGIIANLTKRIFLGIFTDQGLIMRLIVTILEFKIRGWEIYIH